MIFGMIGCLSFNSFKLSIEVDPFLLEGRPNLLYKISASCLLLAILNCSPANSNISPSNSLSLAL